MSPFFLASHQKSSLPVTHPRVYRKFLIGSIACLFFFLFSPAAYALEPLTVNIKEVSVGPWVLRNVALSLAPLQVSSAQQTRLRIDRLTLPQPLGDLSALHIECNQLLRSGAGMRCDRGRLSAVMARFGPVEARFTFKLQGKSGRVEMTLLESFPGSGVIVVEWQKDRWRAGVEIEKENVGSFRPFLARFVDFSELDGQLKLAGKLWGKGGQLRTFAINAEMKGLNSQATGDHFVSEAAGVRIEIEGRYQDRWVLDGKAMIDQGGVYIDPLTVKPVFFDFAAYPVGISVQASWDQGSSELGVIRFKVLHNGVAAVTGHGDFDLHAGIMQRGEVGFISENLGEVLAIYLAPNFEETALEGSDLTGRVQADFIIEEGRFFRFHSVFSGVTLTDRADHYRLEDGEGELFWLRDGDAPPSELSWRKAFLYRIPLESNRMVFFLERDGVALKESMELSLLDGYLHIESFKLNGLSTDHPEVAFNGQLAGISLGKLTQAFSWPSLAGEVAGIIPAVSYRAGTLNLDGRLSVQLFGGEVELTGLTVSHLLKGLPILTTDAKLRQIDLDALTRKFSFGSIEGRLDGDINDLYLEDWRPVSFDAWFVTPEQDEKRHRISQKAVENISSLGGGPAGILSKGVMRFFDSFAYDRIGVGCRLRDGTCQMRGLESNNGGYYLIKGRSLPRIDMIGYNRRIDWNVLLQRLKRVIVSD